MRRRWSTQPNLWGDLLVQTAALNLVSGDQADTWGIAIRTTGTCRALDAPSLCTDTPGRSTSTCPGETRGAGCRQSTGMPGFSRRHHANL